MWRQKLVSLRPLVVGWGRYPCHIQSALSRQARIDGMAVLVIAYELEMR